jgi:serine/threonine protein kinase/WD40 repeat protein
MTTWDPQANEVFLKALELPSAGARQEYLAGACAGNTALRAEVEALLEASARAGSFLESPATALAETVDRPPVSERPGTAIGPYKLLEQIGEGGFGVVFLAEQQQPIRRKVALKVLKPGMDSKQVIARFEAERQALALMDHANIARIFESGETASGRPYFVMELVKGVPITDYCDQNQLPPRDRLELFVCVCQAVQHAHQKGIIHRDLKPSNVLVTLHDGAPLVKVIDFGIAKALGQQLTDRTLFTNFAQLIGTPLYMSPEQAAFSNGDIDTRSDIYALGVLLYELLTGTTPFAKERFSEVGYEEICRIIREEEPPKPSTRISTLGQAATTFSTQCQRDQKRLSELCRRELDWIVMKALEKDRNRRYETASAFAADVRCYLHDEPVLACPPSVGYRLGKLARRHRGPVLAVSLVLLALVGGIIGTTWGLIRATDAEADAVSEAKLKESEARLKEQALTAAQESERHAKDQLFLALFNQARALRFGGQAGQRFESLQALAEAARLARARGAGEDEVLQLRNEAIACLALPDLRFDRVLVEDIGHKVPHVYWIAFDPLFHYVAYSDKEGNISIRRVADGEETARLPGPGASTRWVQLRFSPDGRWLAVGYSVSGRPPQMALWEFREGKVERKIHLELSSGDFSPDGRLIAGNRPDGAIGVYELPSGREVKRLAKELGATGVTFHPNGRQVAVWSVKLPPGLLLVIDLETGKEVARYQHPEKTTAEPSWRGDGRLLAVGCADQRIYIWDHAKQRLQSVLEGHTSLGINVKFSHAGEFLISTSWDGSTRIWDPVSGRQLVREPASHFVAIRGDDRQVALVKEDRLSLWELAGGWECRTLHHGLVGNRTPRPGDWGPRALDFSTDGRLLASSSLDGVRLWDLANFLEVGHLPAGPTGNVLFHPDGNSLFTYGTGGLHRWPVRREIKRTADQPAEIQVLQVGPPQPMDVPGNWAFAEISLDRGGHRLAAVDYPRSRALVLDLDDPSHKLILEHPRMAGCILSPDGRWAVTQTDVYNGEPTTKIWDLLDGKPVSWKPPAQELVAFFTQDSRWLVTEPPGNAPLRFWQLGSWQPGPTLPRHSPKRAHLLPSPDGTLLAKHGLEYVPPQLLDAGTGKTMATLEAPRDLNATGWGFSPNGIRFAVATGNHTIHVWDLRTIRQGLAEAGLDWDLPAYPPAEAKRDLRPIRVEVQAGK